MDRIDDRERDDLADLLTRAEGTVPSEGVKRAVLARTTRELRRRRVVRRVVVWAGMAACYVAGLATMRLVAAHESAGPITPIAREATDALPSQAEPQAVASDAPPTGELSELPPAALERIAEVMPDVEFRQMYRQAGDRYVEETGDLAAAVRCYSRLLDSSPIEELTISSKDNWLIMALKEARLREIEHAKRDERI